MNLRCLSAEYVAWLKSNASENLARYSNSSEWVEVAGESGGRIRETGMEVDTLPHLEMPVKGAFHDAENARLIHGALSKLTPLQAMDERLWAYLTHVHYATYMNLRWACSTPGAVVDRYLFRDNGFGSLVRNGIARLWWFGHVTHDRERSDPYELVESLTFNQDIQTAFLQRSLGKSRSVLHSVLEHVRTHRNTIYAGAVGKRIQTKAKLLNMMGGVTLLDAMPRRAMHEILSEEV